jgi:TolB-like protein
MPIVKAYEGSGAYVFICYSHKDADIVYQDIAWLSEDDVNVWYDEGISPGANWRASIGGALLGATHVLFYVSETSLSSVHCNGEISLALDERIPIIPIYLQDIELPVDLRIGLGRVQALRRDAADFRDKLHRSLSGAMLPRLTPPIGTTDTKPVRRGGKPLIAGLALFGMLVAFSVNHYGLNGLSEIASKMIDGESAPDTRGIEFYESMAVLPFSSFSTEAEVGFIALGITDTILDELTKIEWLKLASRTTASQLSGEGLTLKALAKQMNVAYVLEGSVQKEADSIRVTAQLIRAEDNFHVWSKSYSFGASEHFKGQEDAGERIAQILALRLWTDVKKQHPELFDEFEDVDERAVALFIKSEEQINNFVLGEGGDLANACQLAKTASEIDSRFQTALFQHANCSMGRFWRETSLQEAKAAVTMAIDTMRQNDPKSWRAGLAKLLSLTHLTLDYETAHARHTKINERRPEDRHHLGTLGDIAAREGRVNDASRYYRKEGAMYHEPGDEFLYMYPQFLLHIGEYELSLAPIDDLLHTVVDGSLRGWILLLRARAMIGLNRTDEAKLMIGEAWKLRGLERPEEFVFAFAKVGETQRAREALTKAQKGFVNNGHFVLGNLALGDHDTSFEFLRQGIESHDPTVLDGIRIDVALDELRDDPRFDELLDLLESREANTAAYLEKSDGVDG